MTRKNHTMMEILDGVSQVNSVEGSLCFLS
jgi:hypothetical protein